MEGGHRGKTRRYEPWIYSGLLVDEEVISLGSGVKVEFYSLNEDYQEIIENKDSTMSPSIRAQVEKLREYRKS